ncbi:DUF6911 family protein [Pseudomonas sp. NPDC088444]|uniref:DUF6911 family protein n=1 Tax=Pseudomonas sp. NPDC088444 TaxID=3364456 RepID=UPI00384F2C08
MRFSMSWVIKDGCDRNGGSSHVADWGEVWAKLVRLGSNPGSVSLNIIDVAAMSPFRISVETDVRNYLVTLLEEVEDDTEVRSYSNPAAREEMVELLGDYWDARLLTSDFEFVCMMFKEFFETGDVSRQWLN